MEFTEGLDRAAQISKEVMSLLAEKNLPPLPKSYSVLYAYIADANPDLTKEISIQLENIDENTIDSLSALYDKHFGTAETAEALEDATQQMEGKMGSILSMLATATDGTSEYGENLQENLNGLETSPNNISTILSTLVDQTEDILKKNEDLRSKLQESTNEITDLRENLGSAKREALVDGLTGVANRKCFDMAMKAAVSEANEKEESLCIAMTDIDHFKAFNDTYGHQTGDKVLKAVAQIINKSTRDSDIVSRYGGEEFALILPDMTMDSAFELCERMRVAVSRKKLRNRKSGQDLGRINISIGLAEYRPGESVSVVLKRADSCLYQAKENGRNMTVEDRQ